MLMLLIILVVAILAALVLSLGLFGGVLTILFGDVIVFGLIIWLIVKIVKKLKKKK